MEQAPNLAQVGISSQSHYYQITNIFTNLRWLNEWGISLASERQQRALAGKVIGNNLEAEAVPFSFPLKSGGEEIRPAALAYIPNLPAKVFNLLQENEEYVVCLYPVFSNKL